jgi:hypothetical protein
MRTLYITNTYLFGRSGVVNASKAFVNAFAALSDSMTLVYPQQNDYIVEDIMKQNVKLFPVYDNRSKIVKAISFLLGNLHRFSNETIDLFDKEKFDVVIFDSSPVSYHLIKKAKQRGLKTITIHHNNQIEYTKDDTRPLLKYPLLFWTRKFEKQSVCNSDLNVSLTQTDAQSLRSYYKNDAKFEVLGVFEYNKSCSMTQLSSDHESMTFVITGQLYSLQTENSLLPWINKYYVLLKEQYPNAKVIVAGRSPSDKLISTCRENGIEIIPSPEDIDAIVSKANYYICPTELGSGLKLRIMDGLKFGLEVLAHERSARGYEYMMENEVLYKYNDQQSFIDSLKRMVSLHKKRSEVQKIYHNYFSYAAGEKRLETILKKYNFL